MANNPGLLINIRTWVQQMDDGWHCLAGTPDFDDPELMHILDGMGPWDTEERAIDYLQREFRRRVESGLAGFVAELGGHIIDRKAPH